MSSLSVVVPIYGVEKYIERCVESLFEQTLEDIEFIFIDDCTPDQSMNILQKVIDKYEFEIIQKNYHIRIERMPKNSGLASVRKFGMTLSSGDFVINCDSDDWVEPSMYNKLYNFAIQNNSDLVICDYIISDGIDAKKDKIFHKNLTNTKRNVLFEKLLTTSTINPVWTALIKRELLDDLDYPVGDMSEDKTIMMQVVWHAKNTTYFPEALYYYRLTEGSILRSNNKESAIKKFKQLSGNRNILLNFIKKENIAVERSQLDAFLFAGKIGYLEMYFGSKEIRNLWKNTLPLPLFRVLVNPYIHTTRKIRYLMAIIRIKIFDIL